MKYKFFSMLLLMQFVVLMSYAQGNTYSLVIETTNGTKISLGPNDVKSLTFKDGDLTISGESIDALQSQMDGIKVQLTELQNNLLKLKQSVDNASGMQGPAGKSAYEIALDHGFSGTEAEWLASLRGERGEPGMTGMTGMQGANGRDGRSAYEIALDHGFNGTEAEWLASLRGERGEPGMTGMTGMKGDKGDKGDAGNYYMPSADGYWYCVDGVTGVILRTDLKWTTILQ